MPHAIPAVAAWIGNTVGAALTTVGTAIGIPVTAATGNALLATVAAVNAVSQIAIYAGLQYVVDDISRQKSAPQGQELQLRLDPDMPREMIIGERVVAGSLVARYSRGSNLYNAHFVYQLADHPCVELSKVYGDGRLVQATPLAHGTRTEITAYSYSGGARVWMTWHDGRPGQTVDSDLVTKSAQDPDVVAGQIQGWTNNHLGAGCAYVHIEVQWDSDILTSIPQFLFHVKGAKLYDRRKDTTAGGSGAHRLDDPSTWEYSTNAAVALDHFLLGYEVEGDPLAFGIGLSKAEVPYDIFAAAADLADEDVTTGTGADEEVIKRYACNGIISAGDFWEDVLEAFQNQMAARIVDLGGRIGILGAEERSSVVSLDDDDWASDEAVRYADKLPFSDLYGAVLGSFPDPANLYQPTPYEKQTTSYLALPDGGEATTAQLDLPFEVHPRRAVRLASAWLARESLQPRLVGTFATRSLAWKLEPGDWFTMTSARLQITAELFEVIDIVKHDDFSVTLTARAINANFLAFSVDDDPDLSVPPQVDPYSLLLDEPTFTATASSISASGATLPAIEFTLTSDENVAKEIVVEYGKWVDPDIIGPTNVDSFHIDQIVTKLTKGVLPSTDYKVRAKTKAGLRESPWTAWSSPITIAAAFAVGTADEVPWSGVLDDGGRPDDNADVTAANTAAAIAGQGSLATLNALTEAIANASNLLRYTAGGLFSGELNADLTSSHTAASIAGQGDLATTNRAALPFGVNGLSNTEWLFGSPPTGWNWGWDGNTGLTPTRSMVQRDRRAAKASISGTPANDTVFDIIVTAAGSAAAAGRYLLPAAAGDIIGISARVACQNATSVAAIAVFYDSTGTYISELGTSGAGAGIDGDSVNSDSYALVTNTVTAPANTKFVGLQVRITCSGAANPVGWVMSPMISRLPTGQTAVPAYVPAPVERGSDRTGDNTAAAFSGQGALAVLNSLAYGGAYLTGFGALAALNDGSSLTAAAITSQGSLATLNFVQLNSNVRLQDGSTVATDAMVVTASGTAAAIAGQGDLATTNKAALPFGVNGLSNTEWPTGVPPLGWATGWDGTTGFSATRTAVQRDRRAIKAAIAGTPANATIYDIVTSLGRDNLVSAARYAIPCAPGDKLGISARVACESATSVAAGVVWLDSSGAYISESYVTGAGVGIDGDAVHSTSYALSSGVVTAPSGAYFATFSARVTCSGAANPEAWVMSPMVCRLPAGQTAVPDYHPGAPDRASDQTSSNTAAAISGQGGLATVNFVLFSSTVRLADGTTVVTDAMVVTSSGTSAAIAGQGALATLNQVNTGQVAANAITNAAIQETDASIGIGSSFVEVASVSITVPDAATRVKIDWSAYIEGDIDGSLMDAQLKRDGGVIWGPQAIAGNPPGFSETFNDEGLIEYNPTFNGMVSSFDTDLPGSTGSKTYTLELRVAGVVSGTPWAASYRRLFAMLFNR